MLNVWDNIWFIAAIWMGLALVASLISIRVGAGAHGNERGARGVEICHAAVYSGYAQSFRLGRGAEIIGRVGG